MPLELDETALPTRSDVTATAAPRTGEGSADGRLEPGKRLAHFRIDRLLGEGGMGQVYLATDLALDRPVALKVLPGAAAQSEGRRSRLIREARAQARIHHPNVCHIYYIGEEDGHLFFAMEYVDGESVAELVAKGPLPVDRALSIVKMAAEGLREADHRGFTHRDVKPSNLMVDGAGRVKVVDFGLVTDAPRPAESGDDAVATTGIAGTPLYMAPEQARGEPVDRRADVYALGATLYHLVAGAPPFAAATAGELLALHSTAIRPDLPRRGRGREARRLPAVDRLCRRMMALEPSDRFATYDELIAELDRARPAVTRPAGLVARTVAAILDLVLVIPFQVIGELVPWHLTIDNSIVIVPLLWLYATLATWRFGRTIGKALLDLEVVSIAEPLRRRGIPLRAAAARAAIYLMPLVVTSSVREVARAIDNTPLEIVGGIAAILAFVWAIGALIWAWWRRPDNRTVWDRVTDTMVRYHQPSSQT